MIATIEIPEGNMPALGFVIVTMTGLIAWVLKSALPALLRDFRDQLNLVQDNHTKELAAARAEFRTTLAEFRADLKEMNAVNRDMNVRLSESMDKLADEIAALKASHYNCIPAK